MTTPRPEHAPPVRWHPNTHGLKPIGLEAPGIRVGGLTYWEAKLAWFGGRHLTREQLSFIGAEDPFLDSDRDRWRTDRGWRQAEDAVRDTPQDDERYEAYRGVRWLIDMGDATMELSV